MSRIATTNLPWVEKYRPESLDDLISQKEIVSTIQKFIKEERLPHLLFYGPPGVGKTSTILAVAKQLFKPGHFQSQVLELNASDDRGIGMVRDQVMSFASTRSIFSSGFKLVILDEADSMTKDAQNALRRTIEKFTENTRFCLICNYLNKIIPALQSRCTKFRFAPLKMELIKPRLDMVIEKEKLTVDEGGMKAITHLSGGDMRKALNIMQSTAMAFPSGITEERVYTCTGHPLKADIRAILQWMLQEDFGSASSKISNMKQLKGLALQDIITEVHLLVQRIEFPHKIKIQVLERLAEIEYRLAGGSSEKLQTSAMIAAFQITKEPLVQMAISV